jgi:hypothetical protein
MANRKHPPKPLAALQVDDVELNLAIIRQFAEKLQQWPPDLSPDEAKDLSDMLWRIGEDREDPAEVFGVAVPHGSRASLASAEAEQWRMQIVAAVKAHIETKVGEAKSGKAYNAARSKGFEIVADRHGMESHEVQALWSRYPQYQSASFSALVSAHRRKK